jgi:hypothetical protein
MKIRQKIDPDIEIKLDKNWLPKASSSGKEEALGHQGRSSIGDDDLHLPLSYVSLLFKYHFTITWKV